MAPSAAGAFSGVRLDIVQVVAGRRGHPLPTRCHETAERRTAEHGISEFEERKPR